MTTSLTRRRAISLGLGTGAAIALTSSIPAQAASASVKERTWSKPKSQNDWPILDSAPKHRVEGANVEVSLAKGDVATVLLYVARRYAYEIDMLRAGDLKGYTNRTQVAAAFESNYLSGTALAIRPLYYPLGADVKNTGMGEADRTVVADILADCEGVVAWGGELKPVKQSHFEIAVRPGDPRLKALADRILDWHETPGRGAGAIDAFEPARIRRSKKAAKTR
ncbi:hypothetical protein [Streptomyces shenzhenensis]|uniref:hypothetical protein n=1 Tax=Streptomyces shenzhenensis TaxID=943815 RepID=UPI0036A7BFF9